MKRFAAVTAVALLASVLGAGELPASAQTGQEAPIFQHYIGALHEHSGYSDGFPGSRPADYFASAKRHGLDFLMSGEHSDSADLPMVVSEECLNPAIADCALADTQQPENSLRKWDATLEQARAATDESFTGVRGFEWTSDRFGHINVYFSTNDTNAKVDGGYAVMDSFWEWFARDPLLGGGSDGLATFNHPGNKSLDDADPALNWNNFEYRPEADQRMVGIELYNDNDEFGEYFVEALDAGWHVGAIGAEDLGHRPRDGDGPSGGDASDDWGGPAWAKTVFIATDKTEAGLREAMLARRFYAVRDNSIRLDLSAADQPMGSRITQVEGSTVPIVASANHAARLELITNQGVVAASADGASLSFDAPVTDGETYYFLRILDAAGKPQAYSSPIWIKPEGSTSGQWLAGDLHIHTTYSHDSYGGPDDDNTGPEESYTLGHTPGTQFAVAGARGLDYLAITDHNDVRSQSHFDEAGSVIPVAGYENSLSGHAQMLGARKVYDSGNKSADAVNQMAAALRADGGVFQINHPMEGSTDHGVTPDWKYGFDVVPDTIEVWNISRLWQPPAPSASSNDDGVLWWQEWLDRGFKVGATGGADNHYLATTPIQGAGQPTTWVYATENSEEGVLEGLRAGRTFISHQPPNHAGPQIFIEADANRDGSFESMIGDTVPAGVPMRARVEGAPGAQLRVLTDGGVEAFAPVPVTGPSFAHEFTLPTGTWVRSEIFVPDAQEERRTACDDQFGGNSTYCRNQLGILAMTSALYLSDAVDPSPTPTPTPTSTEEPGDTTYENGETYARVSADQLVVGNGLVERSWDLESFGTTSITDLRDGGKPWAGAGPDFTLDLGAQLSSRDFQATGTTVKNIAGPGLRIVVSLTSPTTDATRAIEIYEGVAGFKTRTTLLPKVSLALSGYTLDSAAVGSAVVPTIHAFRAGADWRDPENGWDGPKPYDDEYCEQYCPVSSVGDPHAGTWRDSRSGTAGEAIEGPAQWVSVAEDDREAFLVMERNDQPSSRATYDGASASLVVDHSRDIVSLGPFEEQIHAENPTPAKGRVRPLVPGEPFPLEPSFMGFGSREGDGEWQFHKYLTEHRLDPYAPDITFNSNGTEGYGFSTGAKDDMVYDIITQTAPKAKALGVDTFILDDGWQANSGDWIPDCPGNQDYRMLYPPRYPDCDFTAVREAIAPMKLGLWMSPMHFNPQGSQTFKAHPEWACWPINGALSAYNVASPDDSSNEAGLGMWGPDAIPHIESRIRHAIEAWEVGYFKFDFLVWADCAGQGDLYDYREAFRDMVDRLSADFPHVTFQTDETNDYRFFPFESVTRGPSWFQNGSPQIPTLLHNLWNLSPYVPAFSLGQHFLGGNGDPNSVDTRMAAALLSHPTFFSDLNDLEQETIDKARPWVDYYKANVDNFQNVVYPLLGDPIDKGWTAFQSWDPEKAEGALLAFRQDDPSATTTVRLKNVPAGRMFDLFAAPTGDKIATVTSEQLTNGFDITLDSARSAYVVTIEPATRDEQPLPTNLALEMTGKGSKRALVATLTDDAGQFLTDQTILFFADGQQICNATTTGAGNARCELPARYLSGRHDFASTFPGDETYLPSWATLAR